MVGSEEQQDHATSWEGDVTGWARVSSPGYWGVPVGWDCGCWGWAANWLAARVMGLGLVLLGVS